MERGAAVDVLADVRPVTLPAQLDEGQRVYDEYRRFAEKTLYPLRDTADPGKDWTEIAKGQAWATLTLAAAIHELAQAQKPEDT